VCAVCVQCEQCGYCMPRWAVGVVEGIGFLLWTYCRYLVGPRTWPLVYGVCVCVSGTILFMYEVQEAHD